MQTVLAFKVVDRVLVPVRAMRLGGRARARRLDRLPKVRQ